MLDGIELASTDELIAELQKRFDHSVFYGVKEIDDEFDASDVRWSGGILTCVGLAEWCKTLLMRKFAKGRRPASGEI